MALCTFVASALVVSGSIASDSVRFTPFGTVAEKCTIASAGNIDRTIDIRSAGSDTVNFSVDCNMPVQVSLLAEQGAFRLVADKTPEHTRDYTSFVEYLAGFTLPLTNGTWAVMGQAGKDLMGRGKTFSPTGALKDSPPFKAALALKLTWADPTAELLAGTYREAITVTITGQDLADAGAM